MARKPDYADGNQLPMFLPNSEWVRPSELPDLRRVSEIGFDTETKDEGLASGRGPGWVYRAGRIAGLSLAWGAPGKERAIYVPISHPDTDNFDRDAVKRWLKDHSKICWVMHNGPYDLGWLRADFDLKPPELIEDTNVAAVMVDETQLSHSLDNVLNRLGLQGKDETLLTEAASAYGFDPKKDMWRMPAKFVGPYAAQDALGTLQGWRKLKPLLEEEDTFNAYRIEIDLVPMIQEMRWRGIRVDLDRAEKAKKNLLLKRDQIFTELAKRLGEKVGMEEIGKNSWLQRHFDAEKISYPRTAPSRAYPNGLPSFTAGSTGWMHKHPHWLPQMIVQADKYNNAAVKFIQGFIIDYAHKGRIHASINQFLTDDDDGGKKGTKTYRFSYSDPALQQMPSRDPELKPLIRGCFVPEPGKLWGRIDYEQQEYRLIVHFAARLKLKKAAEAAQKYIDDPSTDFHQLVADMTKLDRKSAKDANFAKAYGASPPKFAAMTNMSIEEATKVMEQYDELMPFVKALNEKCKNLAGQRGYIRLIDGARIHFPFWEGPWIDWEERKSFERRGFALTPTRWEEANARRSNEEHPWNGKMLRRADTRKAMNSLIQGSAARQTKKAMLDCWKAGYVPLLQVHDELNFDCETEAEGKRAALIMAEAIPLEIPMGADVEWGANWGRAAKEKKGYGATWAEAFAEAKSMS